MKVEFWVIGKTAFKYLDEGMQDYQKRLSRLADFQMLVLPGSKSNDQKVLMQAEARQVLEKLKTDDQLILLDERGKMLSSTELAEDIEKRQMLSQKRVVFLIGGAYGFDQTLYDRSNAMLSLSRMTFSHQIIRLIFLEQLYRAYSIIKGLPYHHE
jgi:23S rRNA (pseudouridine1915-N3)-methyltransferase